jgi:hypothetical protein
MASEIVIRSLYTSDIINTCISNVAMLPEFKYQLMLIFIVFHLIMKSLFLKYI